MSGCAFRKWQRVSVPANIAGGDDVRGVVCAVTDYIGREPDYLVKWQSVSDVDDDLNPRTIEMTMPESALLAAQPPAMISLDEAQKMAAAAADKATCDLLADAAAARDAVRQARRARRQARQRNRKR